MCYRDPPLKDSLGSSRDVGSGGKTRLSPSFIRGRPLSGKLYSLRCSIPAPRDFVGLPVVDGVLE